MKTLILLLFPFLLAAQPRLMGDSSFCTAKAGSNQISLLYDPGFKVGDIVLIPTTAKRGEVGIGDAWPSKRFNTLAELQAATLLPGEYVGCLEDGYVYRDRNKYIQWHYYTEKIIPKGLRAKITSIDGLVFTLDKTISQDVTNATLYYDNSIYLNEVWNYRDDFRLNQGANHLFIFPKGRYAIGAKVYVQKTVNDTLGSVEINGNGSTLFSPSGLPSASISLLVDRATIHDLTIEGNFKDNGFGFDSYPTNEYWNNPYEQIPAILLNGKHGLGYNLHVKNAAGYSFQVFHNSFVRNSSIVLEEGIRSYTGWQMLAIGAYKGAGFRKISFYAPYLSNAMEAARSTDVIFDSIYIVNGLVAMNTVAGINFTNSIIHYTKNAKEGSEGMNLGHAFYDHNKYMALYDGATDHQGPTLIENVHFIQECFIDNAGNTIRAMSFGEGVKDVTIRNCSYTRPDFTNQHSNQHAIFFSDAMNNTIENFTIKGIQVLDPIDGTGTLYRADISMNGTGTGLIKNVKGASSIYAPGVTVENSPLNGISNPGCDVLAWEPDNRDTITRTETVLLFPNPASNFINIKTKEDGLVTVYNTVGQSVNVSKSFNGQFIKINIKHLPSGLYFVHVERKRSYPIKQKFLKQNGRN